MKKFLTLIVLLICFPMSANASGKPQTLSLTHSWEYQNPVEQQTPGWLLPCPDGQPNYTCHDDQTLWVTNPTRCVWDADDKSQWFAASMYLDPGRVYIDDCLIADDENHLTVVDMWASAPLSIVISFSTGVSFKVNGVFDDSVREYHYKGCLTGPMFTKDSSYRQDIPNSNGGTGVPTSFQYSIENPTGRRIKTVGGNLGMKYRGYSEGQCDVDPLWELQPHELINGAYWLWTDSIERI